MRTEEMPGGGEGQDQLGKEKVSNVSGLCLSVLHIFIYIFLSHTRTHTLFLSPTRIHTLLHSLSICGAYRCVVHSKHVLLTLNGGKAFQIQFPVCPSYLSPCFVPVCLPVRLPVRLSVHLPLCPSVWSGLVCLCVCLPVDISKRDQRHARDS